jgi:hypothetical protein
MRFSWYSPEGDFLRGTPARALSPWLAVIGLFPDQTAIGIHFPSLAPYLDRDQVVRPPISVGRLDPAGDRVDSVGSIPGKEHSIKNRDPFAHLFGKNSFVAASDSLIYHASNDHYSIDIRSPDGTLRRIVRRKIEQRTVSSEEVERWIDRTVANAGGAPDDQARLARRYRETTVAAKMPVLRWITVDREGNLWVERWRDIGLGSGPFDIFNVEGVYLGAVQIPTGFMKTRGEWFQPWAEIGTDYILGVWADDLDVEQVRLYRISKN